MSVYLQKLCTRIVSVGNQASGIATATAGTTTTVPTATLEMCARLVEAVRAVAIASSSSLAGGPPPATATGAPSGPTEHLLPILVAPAAIAGFHPGTCPLLFSVLDLNFLHKFGFWLLVDTLFAAFSL